MNRAAVNTFARERHRYRKAWIKWCRDNKVQYSANVTEALLNSVEREIAGNQDTADDYVAHWSIGRDYGADANWVSAKLRGRHDLLEEAKEEPPHVRGLIVKNDPSLLRVLTDYQSYLDWDRGKKQLGVHPLARKEKAAEGFRDWNKLDQAFGSYLLDVGGAAIEPGVQVPSEIVRDFIDKVHAHREYLEPLAEGLEHDFMTQAYIYVTSRPEVLRFAAEGGESKLLQSNYRYGRRTALNPDYTQYCRACGLPFMAFTKNRQPTTKPKYCSADCKRERNNRARRK